MPKVDRVGERNINNFGSEMVIVDYKNANNIDVYFPEYDWVAKNREYSKFKKGNIKCPHERRVCGVHRIVAETFIPNPENKSEVDHINRIRNDNRVENLRWVTRLENAQNRGPKESGYTHKKHKKHIFTEPHSEFGQLFFKTFGIMRADDPKFYARMRARYQYHGHL